MVLEYLMRTSIGACAIKVQRAPQPVDMFFARVTLPCHFAPLVLAVRKTQIRQENPVSEDALCLASNTRAITGKDRKMAGMPPRFPVTEQHIEQVMVKFYAAVRRNPTLGPIFSSHISDWPKHEAKIACFWRNAILFERSYDGNPMLAHMQAGNVRAEHFDIWLRLFEETLVSTLPKETAAAWSALAHRIGRGLKIGVQDINKPADGVPSLR